MLDIQKFLESNDHLIPHGAHIIAQAHIRARDQGLQPEALILFACIMMLSGCDTSSAYMRYLKQKIEEAAG